MKKHPSAYRNDIKNCFVESKLKARRKNSVHLVHMNIVNNLTINTNDKKK